MTTAKGLSPADHNTAAVILEAAEELFGRFGFGKVTMEEIAARAGLGKASLYYYFSTKEELFQAVVYARYTIFETKVKQTLQSSGAIEDRIKGYVEERFEFFAGLLSLYITDFSSIPKNRPLTRQMYGTFTRQELEWLVQLFEEGKETGRFQIESAETVAEAFLHVMSGLRARFLRTVELPLQQSQKRELRRELHFVADIFLKGITYNGTSGPVKPVRRANRNK